MGKSLEWSFLDDAQTELFRSHAKRPAGIYSPKGEPLNIFQIRRTSTVRDREGNQHRIQPGERVKVLSPGEVAKYASDDWLLVAEEVVVGYGRGVESLRTGTRLALLPDLELKK